MSLIFVVTLAFTPFAPLASPGSFETGTIFADSGPAHPNARVARFRYDVQNTKRESVESAAFVALIPAPKTAGQRLIRLSVSHPARYSTDEFGNGIIEVQAGPLGPESRAIVTITAEMDTHGIEHEHEHEHEHDGPAESMLSVTGEVTPAIAALAAALPKGKAEVRIRALYDALSQRLEPEGFRGRVRAPAKTLELGRGDCTDIAEVVVQVARSAGMPARVVGGWPFTQSSLIGPEGRHDWAEVWDGKRWRVVDVHARLLDPPPGDRLVTLLGPSPQLLSAPRYRVLDDAIVVTHLAAGATTERRLP